MYETHQVELMPAILDATRPIVDFRAALIKPLPSQATFLDAMYRYEYLLFGGSAGGGKSRILRWALVELLLYWAGKFGLRNVRVGLFCEDYPSLKDRHISRISREFPPILGRITDSQTDGLCFTLRPEHGEGMIALRNLDDPAKYASSEFAAIAVDELTKNDRQVFDDLRFRKRWPGIAHSPFLAGSNPGSKGHLWVKKLWIDHDFSGDDIRLPAEQFRFIPSRAKENPYLPPSYWQTLHSLPETMRQAMEEGNWDVFAGQYFSEWNRALHVCQPFDIPRLWKRVIGVDYGYEQPSAVGWWALDERGHWYLYRELYQRGLTYSRLADLILDMTPIHEDIYAVVADPSIWDDRPHHGESIGVPGSQVMQEAFSRRDIPLTRGNHERISGWQRLRELMAVRALPDGGQTTRFHVFSTCSQMIRTLPVMIHDPVRVEDLDTDGEDHLVDMARYVLNTTISQVSSPYRSSNRIRQYLRPRPSSTSLVG